MIHMGDNTDTPVYTYHDIPTFTALNFLKKTIFQQFSTCLISSSCR